MDGIFGNRFDLNGDGHMSVPEHMIDFAVFSHFMDEIDVEAAEEAKAARHDGDDLDLCDTSDAFITKDPSAATDGDFVVDDKEYYASLFADVDDMDDLDDEDDFDDDYDEDDDFDDDFCEDDDFDLDDDAGKYSDDF